MEQETLTTQPTESGGTETPSQATPPVSQETAQPQEAGSVQVENGQQSTSSPEGTRPKASDFFAAREAKRENQALRQQLGIVLQKLEAIEKRSSVPPQAEQRSNFDPNKFWTDPDTVLSEREKRLLEQWEKRQEEKFPELYKRVRGEEDLRRNEQEALELIFPKSNPNIDESIDERLAANPQKAQEIQKILNENNGALERMSQSDPLGAAKLANEIYEYRKSKQKTNTITPTKAQMAGTASGSPIGGGAGKISAQDLQAEASKYAAMMGEHPEKRFDPKFMERWNYLKSELSKANQGS